jgi:hypothetical protein
MKVLPEAPQELQVRIWKPAHAGSGSPLKQGVLEVLIDEKQLGSCDVDTLPAGQFTGVGFPLPAELLKAKSSVEVLLRVPEKSQAVFGIYECRIVTHGQDAQATGATR